MVRKRRGEIVRRLVERECAKFQMQRLCRALCGVELVRHMHVRKDRQAGSFGEGMRQQFDPLCGQFRLPVEQSSNVASRPCEACAEEADSHGLAGLLRVRRERPRGRATEQSDELAPFHSISSSASASICAGICKPSAFAVLALTESRKLVGCHTGKSAGFAPLRIWPVSLSVLAFRTSVSSPRERAPACTLRTSAAASGKFGLTSIAIVTALGTSWRTSSSRFGPSSTPIRVVPVRLPPSNRDLAMSHSCQDLP